MSESVENLFSLLDEVISENSDDLVALRRHFHANPELSHEEYETTEKLGRRLTELGFEVKTRPEGTGLIADLTPPDYDPTVHPTVAIRSDIDALPIEELNEVPYASKREGVMHACGHDVHMATVTGSGIGLEAIREEMAGRLRLIFQHAEEVTPGGAAEMVSFGAVEDVDAVIALHVDPELEIGRVGIRRGHFTAAFDKFHIRIVGKSGHGARPHHCVDPIFIATQVAGALYQAPDRFFDARDPVVVSIGSIHAGDSPNVIPELAELQGTIRTLSQDHRDEVEPLLRKITSGVCMTYDANYELDLERGAPAVINDDRVVDIIEDVTTDILGDDALYEIPLPSMGGEDFSYYLQQKPGAMFRLGSARPGPQRRHLLHSSRFDVDERAIALGSRLLARTALTLMEELRELSSDGDDASGIGDPIHGA